VAGIKTTIAKANLDRAIEENIIATQAELEWRRQRLSYQPSVPRRLLPALTACLSHLQPRDSESGLAAYVTAEWVGELSFSPTQ
jgi:hypothetical protein